MAEAYCSSSIMEDTQGSRLSSALGGSVSFGRFLSESLDWGKWSSFSQNRYLEDVQKYSVPGGVAQKKAFFEARYNRAAAKRSAAALEQGSASAHDPSDAELHKGFRSQNQVSDPVVQSSNWSNGVITISEGEANQIASTTAIGSNSSEENSSTATGKCEKSYAVANVHTEVVVPSFQSELPTTADDRENQDKVPEFELQDKRVIQKQPLKESCITNHRTPEAVVPRQKIPTPKQSPLHKRSRLSSSQPSKFPTLSPPELSVRRTKETGCNLSSSKKLSVCSNGNKNQALRSFNMSANLPQCDSVSGTGTPLKAKCSPTVERTRNAKVAVEASDLSNGPQNHLKTPASGRGVSKHDSVAAQTQKKRHSKCTPIKGCKDAIEIASSSVINRSQARTEKKEKISSNARPKSDSNQRRKLHNDASKKSDESEPKTLRESLCFKARPLPAFYKSIDRTSNRTKVMTKTKPQAPELARTNNMSDQKILSSLKQSFAKISSSSQQTREKNNKYTSSSVTMSRNKCH